MARLAAGHRMFEWEKGSITSSGSGGGGEEIDINIPDHVFGFLDEERGGGWSSSSSSSSSPWDDKQDINNNNNNDEEPEDEEDGKSSLENINFWETQNHLLQATLCRTSSLESKIRNIVRQAVKDDAAAAAAASKQQQQQQQEGGNSCLMKDICNRLHLSGFNSAICISKWKTTPHIASGEHTFVDVVEKRATTTSNNNRARGDVTTTTTTTTRVIIEINLRGEFEMGRACEEYKAVMNKVPQVYVGKADRLLSVIKILSNCAKKSFKDQHMHLAPWRRHGYFQAKWFKVSLRTAPSPPPPLSTTTTIRTDLHHRPRRSMLTVDLLDNLPCSTLVAAVGVHRTAVAVL